MCTCVFDGVSVTSWVCVSHCSLHAVCPLCDILNHVAALFGPPHPFPPLTYILSFYFICLSLPLSFPSPPQGVSVEAVDPVFQAKMLDMLKQTGRLVDLRTWKAVFVVCEGVGGGSGVVEPLVR